MQSHARKSSKSFAHGEVPVSKAVLLARMAPIVGAPWRSHHAPGSTDRAVYLKLWSYSPFWRCTPFRRLDGLVEEKRLSNVFDLGDRALEVERLGEDDLEDLQDVSLCMKIEVVFAYLLHVDAVTCAAEDETGLHCSRKTLGLQDVSGWFWLQRKPTYLI